MFYIGRKLILQIAEATQSNACSPIFFKRGDCVFESHRKEGPFILVLWMYNSFNRPMTMK
jgi:hypothetical protein